MRHDTNPRHPAATWLQAGNVPDSEMYRTFNMGVGMIIVVDKSHVDAALVAADGAFVLGEIVTGSDGVVLA